MRAPSLSGAGGLSTAGAANLAATAAVLLLAVPAEPHAELDRADPEPGSTVSAAPKEIAVWFTQRLEPALSAVTVRNAAGQRVDAGKSRVSGNHIRVPLQAIGPGAYQVNWEVLSVDTHRTRGSFSFRIGE